MTTPPGLQDVAQFRNWVVDRLGLHFDESRLTTLAEVLRRRAAANGVAYAAYLAGLAADRAPIEERRALACELTVPETYFFRGPDQLAALTGVALPQRLAAAGECKPAIRVLSVGCASGEEPYSLAIAVREDLPQVADRVTITGFDINPAMLAKASHARYSAWSLREVGATLQARWFRSDGNTFLTDAAIRQAVAFHERNLAQDDCDFWQPGKFDVVFCRNVLMYFTPSQASAAVARIARAIVPGGYLFLGHAETLRGISSDFHLCHTHGTFYYQRKSGGAGAESATPRPVESPQTPAAPADTSWVDIIRQAAERIDALVPTGQAAVTARPPARVAPDLGRAIEYLQHEQFDRALEHLGSLPAQHARDPDVLLLKAVSLSHAGALAASQSVCDELLACDELNAGARYVLALCSEGAGDTRAAFEHDQIAAYLDPAFAMPRLHMGLMARRRSDYAAARRELEQAISLLHREEPARLLLFGGGFQREALIALCRAEWAACGSSS